MIINRVSISRRRASLVYSSHVESYQPIQVKQFSMLHPICTLKNKRMFLNKIIYASKPNYELFKNCASVHSHNSSFLPYAPSKIKNTYNLLKWRPKINHSESSNCQNYELNWKNSAKLPQFIPSCITEKERKLFKPCTLQSLSPSFSVERRARSVRTNRYDEQIKKGNLKLFSNEVIDQKLTLLSESMKVGECTQTAGNPIARKIPLHKITIQMS